MTGIWRLAVRHAWHTRVVNGLLVLCLALAMFLPLTAWSLYTRFEHHVTRRAQATPLVAGALGSRLDLALLATHFQRPADARDIPAQSLFDAQAFDGVSAIGVRLAGTARGITLVGVGQEYFAFRSLQPVLPGQLPGRLGDVVLGSEAARLLELQPGDTLYSDQASPYDLAAQPSIGMRVTGVLGAAGTPDDHVAFVELDTAWLVEGYFHGHEDVIDIPQDDIVGRADGHVVVAPTVIEHQRIAPQNLSSFHLHGSRADLPLSAMVVVPQDAKSRTLWRTRWNAAPDRQVVEPGVEVDRLLDAVLRVKRVFDWVGACLAVATALLTGLIVWLSTRLRAAEVAMLHRIGCGRWTVVQLYAAEGIIVLTLSVALAVAGAITVQAAWSGPWLATAGWRAWPHAEDETGGRVAPGVPVVYAEHAVLRYFVERIAGPAVDVRCPVPRDADPATWVPDDATIREVQESDAVILEGADGPGWIGSVSLPRDVLHDVSVSLRDDYLPAAGEMHGHGAMGRQTQRPSARGTWLDPRLARKLAAELHRVLLQLLPDHQSRLNSGFAALREQFEALDTRLDDVARLWRGREVRTDIALLAYLARRCGVALRAFNPKSGVERQKTAAPAWLERHTARADARAQDVLIDPCTRGPSDGDYFNIMTANLKRLEQAAGGD